jgi:hypothetical protein
MMRTMTMARNTKAMAMSGATVMPAEHQPDDHGPRRAPGNSQPDDSHDEGLDEDGDVHPQADGPERGHQDAAQARQERDDENRREDQGMFTPGHRSPHQPPRESADPPVRRSASSADGQRYGTVTKRL